MIGIRARSPRARMSAGTCVAVLLLVASSPAAADECGPWTWVNPLPQGNHLLAVAAGGGVVVAGGEAGTLLVSTDDGATWRHVDLGVDGEVRDLKWTAGGFLGVSARHILSSPDGQAWTATDPTPAFDAAGVPWKAAGIELQCLASNGTRSLIGASLGTQLHRDGTGAWQVDYAFERYSFSRLAVLGGTWVALSGGESSSYLFSSPTGAQWTARYMAGVSLRDLAASGSRLLAVGTVPSQTEPLPLVVESGDGSKWTALTPTSLGAAQPNAVAWDGARWVLAGQDGQVATAAEPSTWTLRDTGSDETLTRLAWSGSSLVAVGERGTLLTSPDAVAWTPRRSGATDWLYGATSWPGGVVATARLGSVLTSSGGLDWQRRDTGATATLTGAVWTGSRLVVVGYEGTILASPDAAAWTPVASPTTASLLGVAGGDGRLVAVGSAGTALWSDDGLAWSAATSNTTQLLNDAAYGGGTWVAVGNGGTILTSADGEVWTTQSSGTTEALYAVTSNGERFVAGGSSGKLLTSRDGVVWEPVGTFLQDAYQAIVWDGRRFVASTLNGAVFTSPDGLAWSAGRSRAARPLRALATLGDTVLGFGEGGAILRQDCGRQPRARRLSRH